MTHLRLTPAEYRAVSHVCRRLDLRCYDPSTFRRILVLSLNDAPAGLVERIGRLTGGEVRLLQDHLRAEAPLGRRQLTAEEWREFGQACELVPATQRFAYLIRRMVVHHLHTASPGLYRKLSRVSISQFVQLLEKVRSAKHDVV